MKSAGNVLRPYTAFKLSLRLPPLVDGNEASLKLKTLLGDNAPYNARVTFHADRRAGALGATGWNAPELAPWLDKALNEASQAHYGTPLGYIRQGGTIAMMSMLQKGFPAAQMMVCGVLGPRSNAHGPNEFLHVPYGKKLTAAVAQVIAACPLIPTPGALRQGFQLPLARCADAFSCGLRVVRRRCRARRVRKGACRRQGPLQRTVLPAIQAPLAR